MIIWAKDLQNKQVIFYSDNTATINMCNSKYSKCPACSALLRILVLHCIEFNINLQLKFCPRFCNNIADSISCFQWKRFRRLASEADPHPTPIPSHLRPISKQLLLNVSQ